MTEGHRRILELVVLRNGQQLECFLPPSATGNIPKSVKQHKKSTPNIHTIVWMNIVTVTNVIRNAITFQRFSIRFTTEEIAFVQNLLNKQPEVFGEINNNVQNILSDGQLTYHDVPELILVLAKLYYDHLVEKMIYDVDVIRMVQFTIDALLESGLLPIPGLEVMLIEKLVDASLALLDANVKNIQKSGTWIQWISKTCKYCAICLTSVLGKLIL